jgi:transposase
VDRAEPGSKHHLAVDADGTPVASAVTAANVNDVDVLIPLVDKVPAVKGKPGRPLSKPKEVMADRGYDSDAHRMTLSARGVATAIARRNTPHGSGLGVFRYVVEQAVALLHQFRRLKIRYDKRAEVHETFVTIGCAMICWRRLHSLTR